MMDWMKVFGFLGAALCIVAYFPQIYHLLSERCAAGISIRAYCLWSASAVFIMIHAVGLQAPVFILLQGFQLVASLLILRFTFKYKDNLCEEHLEDPERHHAQYSVH